jgi:actin related protein 2/3 complex, subunit 3
LTYDIKFIDYLFRLGQEDIIDEVLTLFRANVLFRNFEVMGAADRTLIYLTLHVVQCLVKCEKIEDKALGSLNAF